MSWFSKLFGAGGSDQAASGSTGAGPAEEYKGFAIRPTHMQAGSEFQLAGSIEKDIDGVTKRYDFVRADRFSSKSEAQSASVAKGRQIIDEQGDRLFDQTWPAKSS